MFRIKNPLEFNKPWILSKPDEENVVSVPLKVTKFLKNYHIMAIEFLYHNYRKGMKGSILNEEQNMNLPLQLSAFFRALVGGPALILVICRRENASYWHYHLINHANFEVTLITTENSTISYQDNTKKLAFLVNFDCLNLCENLVDNEYFSVVIEDFDQIALKRIIKRLSGSFNVGITYRSFYINPDQKLQWTMLNWANLGCVGKLNDFYEQDSKNVQNFNDNYRFWWLRLTWQFCESFQKPTSEESDNYKKEVADWATQNSLSFSSNEDRKPRKRKIKTFDKNITTPKHDEAISDNNSSEGNIVPSEKYVKLPSMDENPIVTSIIKNFEISPEPIISHKTHLTCTQSKKQSFTFSDSQPNCSKFSDESSVCLSFLEDEQKPSTSKSESEEFILNLI